MNKLLLLSCIKGLIFVLKCCTEYNIDFIYCKLGFYSRIKISKSFKIIRPIIFSAVKKDFHSQLNFP